MEAAVDFVTDIARDQLGESFYKEWIPFIGTLFFFIFGCNWAGAVIPWKLIELPEGEFAAPTNDINTTVALALLTSFAYFYAGLSKKGLGYFKRYVQPIPLLLPINILEDFTKPLSLSFRLFGNVLADELTITVLTSLVPLVVPLPIMALGIFAGSVQALIFSTLAAAYIAEVVRGGLQGMSRGQYEAAESMGLNYYLTMRLVILPQALKIVIPPTVSILISAFKDTSLVVIIALWDLLKTTQSVLSNPEWMGYSREAYIFIAILYFLGCFYHICNQLVF